jgi:hypothetical protein
VERGISFEIPNKYGNYIGEILKPVELSAFSWYIGGEESYLVENGTLGEPLFPDEVYGMDGRFLKGIVENNNYYVIFASLKAFPKERDVVDIRTYEQFLNSECQLVLLVIDCAYVTIYCKDKGTLKSLYDNSKTKGFVNVQYITDENDFRTRLSVW